MVQWAKDSSTTGREFSMYLFEILSDNHMTPEEITNFKNDIMSIFAESLKDREVSVQVAALKATAAFLTSIDEEEVVLSFTKIIPGLLGTLVTALNTDES